MSSVFKKKSSQIIPNKSDWFKNQQALARQRGEEYVSTSVKKGESNEVVRRKIVIPAKKSPGDAEFCSEKCRRHCKDKISVENRNKIFKLFYSLNQHEKNCFLFNLITPVKSSNHHSINWYIYNAPIENEKVAVCKKAFCSLFQIGKKKVELLQKSINRGDVIPPPDRRGQHMNRPKKISVEVEEYVTEHIASFPAEESHYSRNKNPNRKYLSPLLNYKTMFSLYKEKSLEENKPASFNIKICSYKKIVKTRFNFGFGHPKSDTCSACDSGNCNEEHKENAAFGFHLQKLEKKWVVENTALKYITYDLQQIMPLPRLSTNKAFYLRQMSFYNLGIHVTSFDKDVAKFFTWTENEADRGSSEIGSCLINMIESDESFRNKELLIWSDSCPGQNKNFTIISVYQYLILKKLCKAIDHRFPEVGHTYLDSDRDFGRIEKRLRKQQNVYHPSQYIQIIGEATKNNDVISMGSQFRTCDELPSMLNIIKKKKNVMDEKILFRDKMKWIRVEEFGSYLYKDNYDPYCPFKKVILFRDEEPIKEINLLPLTTKIGTLSQAKIKNLEEQLNFVEHDYKSYYEDVIREQKNKEITKELAEPQNEKKNIAEGFDNEESPEFPVKIIKKRGRPKKTQENIEMLIEEPPQKITKELAEPQNKIKNIAEDFDNEESPKFPVKTINKRGRPKKTQENIEMLIEEPPPKKSRNATLKTCHSNVKFSEVPNNFPVKKRGRPKKQENIEGNFIEEPPRKNIKIATRRSTK